MKNLLIIALLNVLLLGTSACFKEKPCKSYTHFDTAPVILEYFRHYKPGNYWIYKNHDGSKTDSIWVSDYKESLFKDPDPCYSFPHRAFIVHSQYLSATKSISTSIDNLGYCCGSEFFMKDSLHRIILQTYATIEQEELDGLWSVSDYKLKASDTFSFSKVTFDVKKGPFFYDTILYARDIGIVKFVSFDQQDTFSLIKYQIQ